MAKKEDLFALIGSLNSNEKRWITLQSSMTNPEGKGYLKLYQLYLGMDVYDFDFLVDQYQTLYPDLSLRDCKKRLADHKTHLFEMILRVMRSYNSDQSMEGTIRDLLTDAYFLRSRKLYDRGFRYLEKAVRKARKFEYYTLLLDVLKAKRQVLRDWAKKNYTYEIEAILEEEAEIRELVQLDGALWALSDRLFMKVRYRARMKSEEEKAAIREYLDHELLAAPPPAQFRPALNYHFSKALAHQMLQEAQPCYQHYKAIIDLFEAHPHFIKESGTVYHIALNNYLNACHLVQRYQDFPKYLKVMNKLPAHSPDQQAELFQNYTYLSLLFAMNKPDIQSGLDLIPKVERGLEIYADKINGARIMAFATNISLLAFVAGDLSLARKWNNLVLNYSESKVRNDLKEFAWLFLLVLNGEQGWEGIYEECKKIKKRLKPAKDSLARLFIDFMAREAAAGGIGPKTDWSSFYQVLVDFEPKTSVGYQELRLWISSKVTGQSLMELISTDQSVEA